MPLVTLCLGLATGIGSLVSSGGLIAYLRAPENVTDPEQFRWQKEAFYEPEPDTEEADDLWLRYSVLEESHPWLTTEERLALASAEQTTARAAGYKYPSELMESETRADEESRRIVMQQASHRLAFMDGTNRTMAKDKHQEPRRRLVSTFLRYWVARVRAQFEMRQDRPSDRAAMRTWLGKEMRAAGVRVTHASRAVPMVVRMALLPDEADRIGVVAAEAIRTRTRFDRLRYRFSCWRDRQLLGATPGPPQGHDFHDE